MEGGPSTDDIASFVRMRVGTCGRGGERGHVRGLDHVHSDTGTGNTPGWRNFGERVWQP